MKNKNSFSLIEILVSISILVIILAIFMPKLLFLNKGYLDNELEKIFVVFSYLQQKAIASNQDQILIINSENNSYYEENINYGKNPFALPAGHSFSDGWSVAPLARSRMGTNKHINHKLTPNITFGFIDKAKGPPSNPIKNIDKSISFDSINNDEYKVTFCANGKIKPGTIYLIDKNKNYMVALTCPISQVSYIRKYSFNNGAWVCES